jgi:hypothetical protein
MTVKYNVSVTEGTRHCLESTVYGTGAPSVLKISVPVNELALVQPKYVRYHASGSDERSVTSFMHNCNYLYGLSPSNSTERTLDVVSRFFSRPVSGHS